MTQASPGRGLPRGFDATVSFLGLVLTAPFLVLLMALAAWSTGATGWYSQIRIGRWGRPFELWKIRSMRPAPGRGLTTSEDPRVTRFGRWIRATKLDELPQLWNVLRGDMALVGPRPEVPEFVDLEDPRWQVVLSVPPGLTDATTKRLRSEESLLQAAADPEQYYREVLLPWKLESTIEALAERSWVSDLRILFDTLLELPRPSRVELTARPSALARPDP